MFVVLSLGSWLPLQSYVCAEDDDVSKGRIPTELIDRLKIVVTKMTPEVKIVVENAGTEANFTVRCREYRYHGLHGKGGPISENSRVDTAPYGDGFHLKLKWRPSPYAGAAGGSAIWRRSYWKEYIDRYKLNDDRGYVQLNFEYSSLTDVTILDAVLPELAAVSEQGFPGPANVNASEAWGFAAARLRNALTEIVKKYHPDATWRTDGPAVICEFRTMVFDIHTVDEKGHVSAEAHQETGPQHNGFIVQIRPIPLAVLRQPRPAYGRSYGPQWRHYFAVYRENYRPFRLDIRYGDRTNKKFLKELTDVIEEHFGQPTQF